MQYQFDEAATVQAAAYLLERAGGRLNYTVLMKLLYLADREKIAQVETPITGATYYCMPQGPVLGQVLDYIQEEPERESRLWQQHICSPSEYDLQLAKPLPYDHLSRGDKRILDKIFDLYGSWHWKRLVKLCHEDLPEWHDPQLKNRRRLPLDPADILRALGRNDQEVFQARREEAYYEWFDQQAQAKH